MRRLLMLLLVTACHPPHSPRPVAPQPVVTPPPPAPEPTLETLADGAKLRGFTARALYLDDAGHAMGARFVHDHTGFVFDYLKIESAPQGYIWVTTFPTSDRGEPHTQEHLLLGKGDHGRRLGSFEVMALAESSADTEQWHTNYHFHTVAGNDVFWPVMENQLDALLHPDYTDEEIRREVRNFGVDRSDGGSGALRLEEKGTVYNEMVRTYESPEAAWSRELAQLTYGVDHPLALESGGFPDGIRAMTPSDIRAFHAATYHLANMGMVGAYPSVMALPDVLDHLAAILDRQAGTSGKVFTEADLPRPQPAAAGTIHVVDYPSGDATTPGPIVLGWPAARNLDLTERTLLGLFVDALAGDESTPIYKALIDSKTRKLDIGATGVGATVSHDQGEPVTIVVAGVRPDKLDDKTVDDVRQLVLTEIGRIAQLPDGDPELVAFDARIETRLLELRRNFIKMLDTPPGFGFRATSSVWAEHLRELVEQHGFEKSLTLRPQLAQIEQIVGSPHNPWRDRVKAWGLLDPPYGVAAKPSVALRSKLDGERAQRNGDELVRLEQHYGTKDPQAALAAYSKDYDAETARLEAQAKATPMPPLVDVPPMTLDEGLRYETGEVAGVRSLAATFDTMTAARFELAFDVRGLVADDDGALLAALPLLLEEAGVLEHGKPISAEDMHERIRREILDLSVWYETNPRTHRVELAIGGAGNGPTEAKAAIAWMRRVLLAPDWRIDNLPRLRDLVERELTATRERMQGQEEGWVLDPRDAWWQQGTPEYLHAESFLTQQHDLHRVRWMLLDPGDDKAREAAARYLVSLADAKSMPRTDLAALAEALASDGARPKSARVAALVASARALSAPARALAREAGKDLGAVLAELPDDALAADWNYLCREMARDLRSGAAAALAKLDKLRAALLAHARVVEVGSSTNLAAATDDLSSLIRDLGPQTTAAASADSTAHPLRDRVLARVKLTDAKDPLAKDPLYIGLVAPGTSSGVFVDVARAPSYTASEDADVLDYLAANLYTGHGAHSMFMKTWAAGLAYSNGLHSSLELGTIDYYAERCPLLPQTLRFVIDQLRAAKPDDSIARYAIAAAFGSRLAEGYEDRAREMAANLVDGLTPDLVRAFRTHVLALGKRPDLTQVLAARMASVYAKVLPGLGAAAPDSVQFVIGPEAQLTAYDQYLRSAVGKDTHLLRVFPRDFWLPARL
jgi:Zn-dependent M16 (insulinase) family peptidase